MIRCIHLHTHVSAIICINIQHCHVLCVFFIFCSTFSISVMFHQVFLDPAGGEPGHAGQFFGHLVVRRFRPCGRQRRRGGGQCTDVAPDHCAWLEVYGSLGDQCLAVDRNVVCHRCLVSKRLLKVHFFHWNRYIYIYIIYIYTLYIYIHIIIIYIYIYSCHIHRSVIISIDLPSYPTFFHHKHLPPSHNRTTAGGLVSRVCSGDGALILSTPQAELVNQINSFLGAAALWPGVGERLSWKHKAELDMWWMNYYICAYTCILDVHLKIYNSIYIYIYIYMCVCVCQCLLFANIFWYFDDPIPGTVIPRCQVWLTEISMVRPDTENEFPCEATFCGNFPTK